MGPLFGTRPVHKRSHCTAHDVNHSSFNPLTSYLAASSCFLAELSDRARLELPPHSAVLNRAPRDTCHGLLILPYLA